MFNLITPIPWGIFWLPFISAIILSYLLTWLVKTWLVKKQIFSYLTKHQTHKKQIPRFGGIALFLSFVAVFLIFLNITPSRLGLLIALSIIFLMGVLDDFFNLKSWIKLLLQFMAIGVAVSFGIGVEQIANPFGGIIIFSQFWNIFLSALWLLAITNAINLIDGLDGLAAGTSGIAAISLFILSLFAIVNQPETAVMSIILLGVIVGFIRWNWHPAKIFMGDSGSNMLGFLIGVLAIISGAKIATAALVLGFPLLDMLWSVIRRIKQGRHPFSADQEHLHHRLIKIGIKHQTVVVIILGIVGVFGLVALLSGTTVKLLSLVITALLMILLIRTIFLVQTRKRG